MGCYSVIVGKETRKRTARENNENKFKPSQTGMFKLRCTDLIAGTDDVDDDVIVIPNSPSPVRKKSKKAASIFSQSINLVDEDDSFNFSGIARKSKQPQAPLPTIKDIPLPLVTKKQVTKSTAKVVARSKRVIVSDSDDDDDDVQIVNPEPKRQKQTKEVPLKPVKGVAQKPSKSHSRADKEEANSSISNQLLKVQKSNSIFNLKRKSDESEDDFFSFDAKHAKKQIPVVIKQRSKIVEPAIASTSSSSTNNNVSVNECDENLDLEPGRDIVTVQWLSKSSFDCVKKEEESQPNGMPSSNSLSEPEMKSIFNIIHAALDINESAVELGGGKAFKKKINYKPQTKVVEQRFIDWDDADLLYPPNF